jgi:hypothetical protein
MAHNPRLATKKACKNNKIKFGRGFVISRRFINIICRQSTVKIVTPGETQPGGT